MINPQELEAVARGAAFLDARGPEGWWDKIDLDKLDLSSVRHCILGQLYGDYDDGLDAINFHANGVDSTTYGFAPGAAVTSSGLKRAWTDLITARREKASWKYDVNIALRNNATQTRSRIEHRYSVNGVRYYVLVVRGTRIAVNEDDLTADYRVIPALPEADHGDILVDKEGNLYLVKVSCGDTIAYSLTPLRCDRGWARLDSLVEAVGELTQFTNSAGSTFSAVMNDR